MVNTCLLTKPPRTKPLMKLLKISLLAISIALIFLDIQWHLRWPLFITAALWLTMGVVSLFEEKRKKAKAVFVVYNKPKTVLNYALWFGFLSVNYFFFSKRNNLFDEMFSLTFYMSLSAWLFLSKTGDDYYLFDEDGIKTLRKNYDYNRLRVLRIEQSTLNFDSAEALNELIIKKSLLNDEIINFLKARVSTTISAPV
jgi:hypothetical protein